MLMLLHSKADAATPEGMVVLNNDGFWCWFQDERAIIHNGYLIVGSTAAGVSDPLRQSDVDAVSLNLSTGELQLNELQDRFNGEKNQPYDDHNTPAFSVRPDGRLLAVWTGHYGDTLVHTRVTTDPKDPNSWGPMQTFNVGSPLTYSNPHYLSSENGGNGRYYNFTRSHITPQYVYSDDLGETWSNGNNLVGGDRPYIKFASNGADEIHFLVNDGHPRWTENNSVYHGYYKDGSLHASDGTVISSLSQGLGTSSEATLVYQGDAINRSWVTDLALDSTGKPVGVFSVQVEADGHNNLGSKGDPGEGLDHRYYYGRWDGSQWQVNEMAYAGTRLFAAEIGEDDYTGLIAIDPNDVDTVYISTNSNPLTGTQLVSNADNQRHFEIFKGVTSDMGQTWTWTAITENSSVDNIRPIVPKWDDQHTALLWARGKAISSANYDLDIVGIISGVDSVFGLLNGVAGDVNQDAAVDIMDWLVYRENFQSDTSGLSLYDRYRQGDVNQDGVNDWTDFGLFKKAYDAANGAGAFESMTSHVPEPSAAAHGAWLLVFARFLLANVGE
ncbi:BNR-4 repeat-containing protein [Aeoliella sp. ICT_H6.2]|uniref:BNR-4 repeat-containing protein n=1 Tax=Aeoliella straminimaris TaxID=2954799 RepID=A0A9X2FEX6_9BACT|nr:BNR-4 repeat-containing protein [Aeoliella straminimaris]MCO6046943.1 BNR-4 repeat-containing protein [Aeoliella straminimaris]